MSKSALNRLIRQQHDKRQRRCRQHTDIYAGRVVHCQKEDFDVYIGRPSKWGNPFRLSKSGANRALVLELYRAWLRERPDLIEAAAQELLGKTLGCWCAPTKICHGHVLLDEALRWAHASR